jgi:hypothetical protein
VPKVRPTGVADGQQVNIPALLGFDQDRWGDAARKFAGAMFSKASLEAVWNGKSARLSARKIL